MGFRIFGRTGMTFARSRLSISERREAHLWPERVTPTHRWVSAELNNPLDSPVRTVRRSAIVGQLPPQGPRLRNHSNKNRTRQARGDEYDRGANSRRTTAELDRNGKKVDTGTESQLP